MRIIGGTHRGRIIERVGRDSTRETADMVKLAVFNMIGVNMHGNVLDLFAGSGAYGLESISRGASHAHLVDVDKIAYQTIISNAKKLDMIAQVTVINQDYQKYMDSLPESILFEYIFLDPPYEMNVYEEIISKLASNIDDNGLIICESKKVNVLPDTIACFKKIKDKTYGIKRISIYEKA
jgi:16S rRNA (guanine(966)-N(2))-methyltransferase RsmD